MSVEGGEPEMFLVFLVIICELAETRRQRFAWDDHGRLHKLGDQTAPDKSPLVIKLTEADPVLEPLRLHITKRSESTTRGELRCHCGALVLCESAGSPKW